MSPAAKLSPSPTSPWILTVSSRHSAISYCMRNEEINTWLICEQKPCKTFNQNRHKSYLNAVRILSLDDWKNYHLKSYTVHTIHNIYIIDGYLYYHRCFTFCLSYDWSNSVLKLSRQISKQQQDTFIVTWIAIIAFIKFPNAH